MVKGANQRIIAMHLTMVLYRGAILQTIDKVALQTTLIKHKVRSITQLVLKIDFGPYALKEMLTIVHMVAITSGCGC